MGIELMTIGAIDLHHAGREISVDGDGKAKREIGTVVLLRRSVRLRSIEISKGARS